MGVATIIGELVLGWLIADLITGVFHWWEDRFGREEWPVIGPWLIAPNRLHHTDLLAFTRHGFWQRNRASIFATAMVWFLWMTQFGFSYVLLAACIGGALANEVHRYAHLPKDAPVAVSLMQQSGLIQSPKGHAQHHRGEQDQSYCILTDWVNPWLDYIGLFPKIERVLGRAS